MIKSILAVLEDEHTVIESALDALQRALLSTPDWDLYSEILVFLGEYADKFHHEKEENLLFPRMVERGVPNEGGPVGCMLDEHGEARALVQRMREACGRRDPEQFHEAAREYIPLLRQHIAKENNILFPMARRALNAADDDELSVRCAEVAVSMPEAEQLRRGSQQLLERAFSAKS